MRTLRWLFVVVTCLLLAAPTRSMAQEKGELKKEAENLGKDILKRLFSPRWDIHVHGGLSNNGRFLLQRPFDVAFGERELTSNYGFAFGAGAGVDLLLRTGFRLDYTFSSSDLEYRTDNGDGSEIFDIDDVGKIKRHAASLELIRYLLPARAHVTPYFSVGVLGAWWVLGQETNLVVPAGGSTQFRWGALGTLGVRANVTDRFDLRLEAQKNSIQSPFTGRDSFRSLAGVTIDEPTRVSENEFRLIAVYRFYKPDHRGTAANKE